MTQKYIISTKNSTKFHKKQIKDCKLIEQILATLAAE